MTAKPELTSQLKAQVLTLETDLRTRLEALPETKQQWRDEYNAAISRNRTAAAWETWRDEQITQVAVAWVLTTVFIRFCEDNRLVGKLWFTAADSRRQQALDAQQEFLRAKASQGIDVTDRDWILDGIEHLKGLRATANLVDANSPLWLLSPSGDAATALIDFWRARDDSGELRRDLTEPEWDTRFLGDLYQNLSESAKKKYALLQTPVFVEEFILDRTFEPALAERPLDGFKAIDPTCGSGHFLLGLFSRLLDRWHAAAPGMDERARVQKALDSVYGVDLNPFAVAIARFRLTLAALKASCGTSLEDAPAFGYHLAVGDSLLFGSVQTLFGDTDVHDFAYTTEDRDTLERILADGQYDVVVGNPPYVDVEDPILRDTYKQRYRSCVKQWTLAVPFMEKFYRLCRTTPTRGRTGQITANAFMKRDFGKHLIREFLTRQDLAELIDTSGFEIPGHQTPTVIVIGRPGPATSDSLRVSRRIGREGSRTRPPGPGWRSLAEHIDDVGWQDDWIAIEDSARTEFAEHPWTLTGGGEIALKKAIESESIGRVSELARRIGFYGDTHADDAYLFHTNFAVRVGLPPRLRPTLVRGEALRDWQVSSHEVAFRPYEDHKVIGIDSLPRSAQRTWWPLRTTLWARADFSGGSYRTAGRNWLEWHQLPQDRGCHPTSVAFAFKAPQLHAVIDRSSKVFNSTSPVIKFPSSTAETAIQQVAALLNSSVATFWARQVAQHQGGGAADLAWAWTYEFSAAIVGLIPRPKTNDMALASELDTAADTLSACTNRIAPRESIPTRAHLDEVSRAASRAAGTLRYLQEELDWWCYAAYALIDTDLSATGSGTAIRKGERAFEIALARRTASEPGLDPWFVEEAISPTEVVSGDWAESYRKLVERRIEMIESNAFIGLLERPEYKRRWASELWEVREKRALAGWLLDRLEDRQYWFDHIGRPVIKSIQLLADEVGRDDETLSVLRLWDGRQDIPTGTMLASLLNDQVVPFLAAYRYKDSGLRKRAAWESTWDLQRREDAGETLASPTPAPPKYATADFVKQSYWSHRGKLDVPKERFILYPNAGRDTDPTPVLGWAGWDHAQQSLALATLTGDRSADGWEDERLVPLVAGLAELLPWVKQWHSEFDPFYSSSPAQFFTEQLSQWAGKIRKTVDELAAWRPAPATRGRRRSTT